MSEFEETTKDRGDALEANIEFLFKSAGFETRRNSRIATYEIDVLAKLGDTTIVVECKNYQNSSLTIRNLIHQWNSKNVIIRANKIILALAGLEVKSTDYELAREFDIEIWNDATVAELFSLTLRPSELKSKLIEKLEIKPVTIGKFYRDKISELVIRPLLRGEPENNEIVYLNLNRWLRTFIRTNLQIEGTNKEDRAKHIELFEGAKSKKVFFNLLSAKRSEVEYWQKLHGSLSRDNLLPKSVQEGYLEMMSEILNEYKEQCKYFASEQYEVKIRRLIKERLFYALTSNKTLSKFTIKTNNPSPSIEVSPRSEGSFVISVENLTISQVNVINWLMTCEETPSQTNVAGRVVTYHSWLCSTLDETAEKVFRIIDEFIGIDADSQLRDLAL